MHSLILAILRERYVYVGIALMIQVLTLHYRQELLDQGSLDNDGRLPIAIVRMVLCKSNTLLNPPYLF
jgi:hypothetical protein